MRHNFYMNKGMTTLAKRVLDSHYSHTEACVLYEIGNFKNDSVAIKSASIRAADVLARLDLDAGYLSRCLGQFERVGLITRPVGLANAY
jgi:DNA-binding MarR family transcriptional regulator